MELHISENYAYLEGESYLFKFESATKKASLALQMKHHYQSVRILLHSNMQKLLI